MGFVLDLGSSLARSLLARKRCDRNPVPGRLWRFDLVAPRRGLHLLQVRVPGLLGRSLELAVFSIRPELVDWCSIAEIFQEPCRASATQREQRSWRRQLGLSIRQV